MTTPFPFVSGAVLQAQQLNDIQNLPISDKTANYVLVVGDVTKRTIMNSASATTITVDDAIFTVGDVIQVANKGAGTCTITAGAGVTINTSGSLALAQYGGGYLLCLSASTFTFFNLGGGVSYGTATGGSSASITVGGVNYTLLTFTSDDNLVVSKAGLFDVYMVGAGGGGGFGSSLSVGGGGGGAGGLLVQTIYLSATTHAVDIGAGGAGGVNGSNNSARNGFGSSIGSASEGVQIGGGGGGGAYQDVASVGTNGGGGGGVDPITGGSPSTPLGFSGGNGNAAGGGGGGGGGHTANGSTSGSGTGAAGGAGQSPSTFTGGNFTTTIGVGGNGGNATGSAVGAAGGANTGNGGGGSGGATNVTGGAGGSGRIFVRFKV
jgi:hypothetical protein